MDITDDEKNSFSIIECIMNGKTSDEEISDETEIKLNEVRKVLYKLYDAGIASYKRTKDPETKWEVYSWKFEQEKVSEIISKKYEIYPKRLKKPLNTKKKICSSHAKTMVTDTNSKMPPQITLYVQYAVKHSNIWTIPM